MLEVDVGVVVLGEVVFFAFADVVVDDFVGVVVVDFEVVVTALLFKAVLEAEQGTGK